MAQQLIDYETNETIREATGAEARASAEAATHDGGAGVIRVDGRRCYVPEEAEAMGARYHVESYGPGRTYYSWGDPLPLDEVKRHPGPEGWLHLRRVGKEWVVDVRDDECPPQLDGRSAPGGAALVDDTGEDVAS